MSIPVIIFLSVASAMVIAFGALVIAAIIRSRRFARIPLPPAPPFKCPACASEEIDILSSGLWDGVDTAGRGTGGVFRFGTCKQCGVHAQYSSGWDHDKKESSYEIRKMTDEEWRRASEPDEKHKQEVREWPFIDEGQNHST